MKKEKITLHRGDYCDGNFWFRGEHFVTPDFCVRLFRRILPQLTKGMKKGETRECILTHLENGFKIELAKKGMKSERRVKSKKLK